MKIKIEEHGHQYFREYIGEVIMWSHTVEKFENSYMQVPCVLIKCEKCIEKISLRTE